jgi:hypothetical protein
MEEAEPHMYSLKVGFTNPYSYGVCASFPTWRWWERTQRRKMNVLQELNLAVSLPKEVVFGVRPSHETGLTTIIIDLEAECHGSLSFRLDYLDFTFLLLGQGYFEFCLASYFQFKKD